jgi:CheY-like chemotaxis protein
MSKTVLIVDDDPTFLSALSQVLTGAGYSVITATDGAEAISVLATHAAVIDAAIVDLAMPTLGGFSVISKIAKIQKLPIPLIAVTGAYSDTHLEVAEYLGAKVSLRKPFGSNPLTPILNALMELVPPPVEEQIRAART